MGAKTLLAEGVFLRQEKEMIIGEFLLMLDKEFLPCIVTFIIRRDSGVDVSLVFFSDDFGILEDVVARN